MATMEKKYKTSPEVILNAVADIAEMRKGKSMRERNGDITLCTEMYKIKTLYNFRFGRDDAETTVAIQTDGEDSFAQWNIRLMFATLDHLLPTYAQQEDSKQITENPITTVGRKRNEQYP